MTKPWHLMGRVAAASAVLAVLLLLCKTQLVLAMLPLLEQSFSFLTPDFKVLSLVLTSAGADQVVEAQVVWSHIVVIGGHVIYPDPRGIARASTLSAHALQGPAIALLVAACWPASSSSNGAMHIGLEIAVRLAAAVVASFCVLATDLPVTLAGELWSLVYDSLDPGRRDPLVIAKDFLQAGGRFALGAAAGLISVYAGRAAGERLLRPRLSLQTTP